MVIGLRGAQAALLGEELSPVVCWEATRVLGGPAGCQEAPGLSWDPLRVPHQVPSLSTLLHAVYS